MQINDRESRSDIDAPDEIDAGNSKKTIRKSIVIFSLVVICLPNIRA